MNHQELDRAAIVQNVVERQLTQLKLPVRQVKAWWGLPANGLLRPSFASSGAPEQLPDCDRGSRVVCGAGEG